MEKQNSNHQGTIHPTGKDHGGDRNSAPRSDFGPERLGRDLRAGGVELNEAAVVKLWKFHQILRERNRELNVTRLHSYETIVRKHYIDCLMVPSILKKEKISLDGPIMDLGTGGGSRVFLWR